jgi:hypothetical protein
MENERDQKPKSRDSTGTTLRPGAVFVPGSSVIAATSMNTSNTTREPTSIALQMTQLREPGEVAGPSLPTTKKKPALKIAPSMIAPALNDSQIKMKTRAERSSSQASDAVVQPDAVAVEQPSAQPGAVALQGASTQQNNKLRIGPKQPPAHPGAGSADRTSQPREPAAVAGPASTAKKSSEDQDIEEGQLARPNDTVDSKQENVSAAERGASSGAVRPRAIAVRPGTITTQSVEASTSPLWFHRGL